jgi:hypothetical protein
MTDRDPYGRRRTPDERDYQSPGWEDEAAGSDPYDYQQPPRDSRRSPEPASRQPGSSNDPFLPANDPYASNRYRQPEPPYGQPTDRPGWDDQPQPTWPDRPYAPGGRRAPQQQEIADPYGQSIPPQRRPPAYDDDDYGQPDDLAVWEEEQRRGQRRPQRPPRQEFEDDYRRRPSFTMPTGLSNAVGGQDSRLLLIIIGSVLSLFAMVAVTALRTDSVGWFPIHINAAGEPTNWGSESALWRLPFTVGVMTIMNLIAGFVLGLRDRKLTWLMVVALPVLHIVAWIALILIAW